MQYRHTQRSPLGWLLLAFGIIPGATLLGLWNTLPPPSMSIVIATILGTAAALFMVLAASFWSLTVEDDGEALRVRYGPLPLFGTRVPYATITSVARGRSAFIDGWGIHYIPGRGWTYNLWGRECVVLTRGGRMLRIGTDDGDGLAAFLQTKLQSRDGQVL